MHLSRRAWFAAWENIGNGEDPIKARKAFARDVFESTIAGRGHLTASDPSVASYGNGRSNSAKLWQLHFPHIIGLAVGAAGLLHDVGHTPFSHVLEEGYSKHSRITSEALTKDFVQHRLTYPKSQFHEFAGQQIVWRILDDPRISSQLPREIIRQIFSATVEGSPEFHWAWCIHQLIDGQIDVDRLDYISRDSMRAGTTFHAIDNRRLLRSLELHHNPSKAPAPDAPRWQVGIGSSGISAIEGLLSQREQSYRWMIFHRKAIAADTALKRCFDFACQSNFAHPILDHVRHWDAPVDENPQSYEVDDHRVIEWLRGFRRILKAEYDIQTAERLIGYMRLWDELSTEYYPSWRNFGEYKSAVEALNEADMEALRSLHSTLKMANENEDLREGPFDDEGHPEVTCDADSAKPPKPLAPTLLVNELFSLALDRPDVDRDLDVELEEVLNESFPVLRGEKGHWLVAHRARFSAFKSDDSFRVWHEGVSIPLEHVSPIASGLHDAERMRPIFWAFFIPVSGYRIDRANERDALGREVGARLIGALMSILLR